MISLTVRMRKKAFFNWSGGKDSALALYKFLQDGYDIHYLLTTLSSEYQRISMHGVRLELLESQAKSIGINLVKVFLPEFSKTEEYEAIIANELFNLKKQGIEAGAFGDIFLEDLRQYRVNQLGKLGLEAVFPLWKGNSKEILNEFIELGFKTIVVCVNEKYLDQSFVGRIIDQSFINDLPSHVDACGENGEYHTFVFDGPIFTSPVPFSIGEKTYRTYENAEDPHLKSGFWFCDLIPH